MSLPVCSNLNTSETSSDSDRASAASVDGSTTPAAPRKPIPRKGHTKSRRGCFNCKRRRIKCNENYPNCSHCVKAGLRCEYPTNIIQNSQRSPSPQDAVQLRSTPGTFTMSDMRLFHHFLITGYPHLPVGADKIWITVIPSLAHNYEYLIHSILALAASHLDAISSANVGAEALSHRVIAVRSLNEALSHPAQSRSECDARMAAALALAFQSSHLQDGLAEFLTMIRGCNIIAGKDQLMNPDSAFHAFREAGHVATMQNRLSNASQFPVDTNDLDDATASIKAVETLPLTDWEEAFHNVIVRTLEFAYNYPVQAYTTFVTLYNLPSRWTHDQFQSFINPHNSTSQILLAHFIAVQAILSPILSFERMGFQGVNAPTALLSWIENIYRTVPDCFRPYLEWCRTISRYPFHRINATRQIEYDP